MSFKSGFVAVIGRPNVGKSTLINELIGQKLSITSNRPQTTRHRIYAIDTQPNYQLVFVDTPGIHIGKKKAINSYMNKSASSSIIGVSLILWLLEVGKWTAEDGRVLEHIKNVEIPTIICINKIDRLNNKDEMLPFLQKIKGKLDAKMFPLSAFNAADVKDLRKQILQFIPAQNAIFDGDFITDRSEKFVVAEFIREKLMRNLEDELPYDLGVDVEKYQLDGDLLRISARIYVAKASQKGIIIGHHGAMLKKIGTEARKSIEGFLGKKVFLQLWVKVLSGWADDKKMLQSLGYN